MHVAGAKLPLLALLGEVCEQAGGDRDSLVVLPFLC